MGTSKWRCQLKRKRYITCFVFGAGATPWAHSQTWCFKGLLVFLGAREDVLTHHQRVGRSHRLACQVHHWRSEGHHPFPRISLLSGFVIQCKEWTGSFRDFHSWRRTRSSGDSTQVAGFLKIFHMFGIDRSCWELLFRIFCRLFDPLSPAWKEEILSPGSRLDDQKNGLTEWPRV